MATSKPLDDGHDQASVAKTGALRHRPRGAAQPPVGAREIAARIADQRLFDLLAPVKRVTGYDTVMPLPKLEAHYMPSADDIVAAALDVMRFQ